jgi:hypothetical protein
MFQARTADALLALRRHLEAFMADPENAAIHALARG